MEDRKKENATNEDINLQADTLTDLPVADEQAEEVSGSADPYRNFKFKIVSGPSL